MISLWYSHRSLDIEFEWLSFWTRNDISGALSTILENAPYGPSVDEAKVRTSPFLN